MTRSWEESRRELPAREYLLAQSLNSLTMAGSPVVVDAAREERKEDVAVAFVTDTPTMMRARPLVSAVGLAGLERSEETQRS